MRVRLQRGATPVRKSGDTAVSLAVCCIHAASANGVKIINYTIRYQQDG